MDASASATLNSEFSKVYGLFLQLEDTNFAQNTKPRGTVIKFAKIPGYELDNKEWSHNQDLQPRLRRIVSLKTDGPSTTRSLKSDVVLSKVTPHITRKIATITEDDENSLHPNFSRRSSRPSTNRESESVNDLKNIKMINKTVSSVSSSSKYSREKKSNVKLNNINSTQKSFIKLNNRTQSLNMKSKDDLKNGNIKEKGAPRNLQSNVENAEMKPNVNKNVINLTESDKKIMVIKNKLQEDVQNQSNTTVQRRPFLRRTSRSVPIPRGKVKNDVSSLPAAAVKSKTFNNDIIHVPLDKNISTKSPRILTKRITNHTENSNHSIDQSTETDIFHNCKDAEVLTEHTKTYDQVTEMGGFEEIIYAYDLKDMDLGKDDAFDNLHIPNVTLTKDKSDPKDIVSKFSSQSMPNLKVPALNISQCKSKSQDNKLRYHESSSYIIGQATVTYTTKQKINFHMMGKNTPVPLSSSPLTYPLSVMSVYKNELKSRDSNRVTEIVAKNSSPARPSNSKALNYPTHFNDIKLVKPSDIINSIRINSGPLPTDYITEQFQRELNFIDSFFESLQYLENCSLTDKSLDLPKKEKCTNRTEDELDSSEYNNFLSNLENDPVADDSKNLCLLNLLIRDEQRRAKNLLFVLKMREDALKDFTKSQILYLENKKKHDNTDISALKKKQRGALLKLQHECGEMQRMRKALLTLSEKRKTALLRTKKNIELKLSNVDDKILSSKRKLRRTVSSERCSTPLKCFELSSGCDESVVSRPRAEEKQSSPPPPPPTAATEARTDETSSEPDHYILAPTNTTESYVAVDGGYLNILFQNLGLPQIFTTKQYEVNEEALKNVIKSANTKNTLNDVDLMTKFMEQFRSHEEKSSSPSTAHSLVEEFDQYYKVLAEDDREYLSLEHDEEEPRKAYEMRDSGVQESSCRNESKHSMCTMTHVDDYEGLASHCVGSIIEDELESSGLLPQAGPLPVPVGASVDSDAEATTWQTHLTQSPSAETVGSSLVGASSELQLGSLSSANIHTSLVNSEAERLRKEQLAIEKEIQALEQQQQQQCMLVVREIPNKPPPPYTPPGIDALPKPPKKFLPEHASEDRIHQLLESPQLTFNSPEEDAFNVFVNDFCREYVESQKTNDSDKPWDACNLLPKKPELDADARTKKTIIELTDVLTPVPNTSASGLGMRRSDHVDDILHVEWRRREAEWTSLHADEVAVKNQIFESIFETILTDTIEKYKALHNS